MKNSEYPNYYQASDACSIKAQKDYLIVMKIDLISMVIASSLAIYNYQTIDTKLYIYVISGVLLLLSVILTLVLKLRKYEDIWYQGRALSESCKTITWRFISCSEYFEQDINVSLVKERFIKRIKQLSQEFKELHKVMDSKLLNLPIITNKMLELREQSLQDRKKYYIERRVNEQKKWYSDKAESNFIKHKIWFWIIIISQVLALISIIVLIKFPEYDWNLVGLFTTISASAISWLQLKQHQELKQAYTTASQELNFIESLAESKNTEEEFSQFVLDSENAISREHTLWLAQRRK